MGLCSSDSYRKCLFFRHLHTSNGKAPIPTSKSQKNGKFRALNAYLMNFVVWSFLGAWIWDLELFQASICLKAVFNTLPVAFLGKAGINTTFRGTL